MQYVGVMTGTSIDGLDVALLNVDGAGRPIIVQGATVPLPGELRMTLRQLSTRGQDDVDRLGHADTALGEFIGHKVLDCLTSWGIPPRQIRAIGSHGQTVRHRPTGTHPFTLQIGDPSRIVEVTRIDTVADFRRRDMAAGGQGAPLVPLFHHALFRNPERHRIILNVGGIANATVLGEDSAVTGFDTGPGNALLDAWTQKCHGQPYDRDGAWAASGTVVDGLLACLKADGFVRAAPPKSTGKEVYNLGFVRRALAEATMDAPEADVQATLAAFTAWSVAFGIRGWGALPPGKQGDLVVCGGGRHNVDLMARLGRALPEFKLITTDDLGVDGDALEAAAFAWFAHRTLNGKPSNAPSVTGASGDRVLGAIYLA